MGKPPDLTIPCCSAAINPAAAKQQPRRNFVFMQLKIFRRLPARDRCQNRGQMRSYINILN